MLVAVAALDAKNGLAHTRLMISAYLLGAIAPFAVLGALAYIYGAAGIDSVLAPLGLIALVLVLRRR